jgi:hypothetical protein
VEVCLIFFVKKGFLKKCKASSVASVAEVNLNFFGEKDFFF